MRSVDNLKLRSFAVELHWVPAHVGKDGNEAADKSAKEATGWMLKKLRRGRTREENTSSTAPKAQHVKELLLASKTHGYSCFGRMETKVGQRDSRSRVAQTRTLIEERHSQTAFGPHKRI